MLVALNFAEELQDFIVTNTAGQLEGEDDLVAGENFLIGDILNLNDLSRELGGKIILTMFEEGGSITRTGRQYPQERTIRFLYKSDYGQGAVNRCWKLLQWLQNKLYFGLPTFTTWLARTDKLPSVIAADAGGTHLADFVVTFFVRNRTG